MHCKSVDKTSKRPDGFGWNLAGQINQNPSGLCIEKPLIKHRKDLTGLSGAHLAGQIDQNPSGLCIVKPLIKHRKDLTRWSRSSGSNRSKPRFLSTRLCIVKALIKHRKDLTGLGGAHLAGQIDQNPSALCIVKPLKNH